MIIESFWRESARNCHSLRLAPVVVVLFALIGAQTSTANPGSLKRVGSTAQRLQEIPYEKRVCRLEAHYPKAVNPGEPFPDLPVDQYVEMIADAGYEVCIVSGEFNRGTPRFHSEIIEPHPNVEDDLLPLFLRKAHEKGIVVLSYYPINFTKPLLEIHPEWQMQFLDDGREPIENEGWFCYNSPYRDWLPEYIMEYLEKLDIDGFYFDDANYGSHQGGSAWYPSCICQYCERLFRDETGLEIPRVVDFDSQVFKRYVNWRYGNFQEFVRHLFGKIRERYPDVVLDLHTYYKLSSIWAEGHPLASLRVRDYNAHLFTAAGHSLRSCGFSAKVLRATGDPFAIFRGPTQRLEGFGTAPFLERYSPAIFSFSVLANGGVPCGDPYGKPEILQQNVIRWVFSELKKRRDFMGGETIKYVGLHYSQQNRDFRLNERPKNTRQVPRWEISQKDVYGTYEMLNRSHHLLDIVFDEHLTADYLSEYPVLFLSNSACLSDRQCDAIRSYVEDGGTLVATFQTSTLDELGNQRDNFGLADLLGVNYVGLAGGEEPHPSIYLPRDDDLARSVASVFAFHGLEAAITLRSGSEAQLLFTRGTLDAESKLRFFDPNGDYDTGEPAVVLNRVGKGKTIYVAAELGAGYLQTPYPKLKSFLAALVEMTPPPIQFEAPEAIEVTAARNDAGEVVIHLLNNPTPVRVDYQDFLTEVVPVDEIEVRFNGMKVENARLPLSGSRLVPESGTFTLPPVELHDVLIAQVAD